MNNDKQKKGVRLRSLIKETVSLPSDAFASGFGVEMRGRGMLIVSGCRRIVKYAKSEMIFAARGFFVAVRGDSLVCTAFHGGTLTVEGRIDVISFYEEEET